MENKELKTTEAHRRASIKWQKENYKRIPLDVPKEYHLYLADVAKSRGMSLNGFIKQAIEEKCENVDSEIPAQIIPNLMKWLKKNGHTEEEIVECLKFITEQQ